MPLPNLRDTHPAVRQPAHRHLVEPSSRVQTGAEPIAAPLVCTDARNLDVLPDFQPVNAGGDLAVFARLLDAWAETSVSQRDAVFVTASGIDNLPRRDGVVRVNPVAPPPTVAIWPESRYLVRMSRIAEAQEKVFEITLGIPDSENSRVHDDIADIALSLPPALAAKLVPQLSRYTESPIKLLLAEKIANLIPHLAGGGQGSAALRLAAAALALAPDPRSVGDDNAHRRTAEPQPRFGDWYYARIIHKALPALVESLGLGTVDLFCGLLDDAAHLSFREEEQGNEDYFYIRQPAIEQGAARDDVASLLLCATRDAATQVISADGTTPEDAHREVNDFLHI